MVIIIAGLFYNIRKYQNIYYFCQNFLLKVLIIKKNERTFSEGSRILKLRLTMSIKV